jgi:hypothetical protein
MTSSAMCSRSPTHLTEAQYAGALREVGGVAAAPLHRARAVQQWCLPIRFQTGRSGIVFQQASHLFLA